MKLTDWKLAFREYERENDEFATVEEIKGSTLTIIDAAVPGNVETDLIRAKLLPEDIFFGENVLKLQEWENTEYYYFTEFEKEKTEGEAILRFGGIDTYASVYIDGCLFAYCDNMLIPQEIDVTSLDDGKHEVVVHIKPALVYSQEVGVPEECFGQRYNNDSLVIRKAPYMYGWDIMNRCVSAGLWKEVELINLPKERIADVNIYEDFMDTATNSVQLELVICLALASKGYSDYTVRIEGECGESRFCQESKIYSVKYNARVQVENAKLWWPKNYGEQNLYNITISLLKDGKAVDIKTYRHGIRIVTLDRTSCAGPDGKFEFKVNNKRIFAFGTNWVPTHSFPSLQKDYDLRGLELVNDINCNMIRCWGGNIYPDDALYDYCDEHGILIWQDFSMACGIYPNNEQFQEQLREEVISVVKRLRNHACLAIWSGDNECDEAPIWHGSKIDGDNRYVDNPNNNVLTRKVIPEVLRIYDRHKPYIPSSPYLDDEAYLNGKPSEDHLWGPRDFFKGDFYNKNSVCHFASETGYHGCPSPETLYKIIGKDRINSYGDSKLCSDSHWLLHSSSPEASVNSPYAYRVPLMTRQVERLFTKRESDINDYALQSQISQAEADKFFIEHFRMGKWYRTGIIWWNIIDGCPQVSDAVVDWYGVKKLAYAYIKRAQMPFAMMIDEPNEFGRLTLCASNDSRKTVNIKYEVSNGITGEALFNGECTVLPDELIKLEQFDEAAARYIVIKWSGDENGLNHFVTSIGDKVDYAEYKQFMKNCGFDKELFGF